MDDIIEKRIELRASLARVWRALTDYSEFGEWFRVKLDGPFAVGKLATGHITYPGYEHIQWKVTVKEMQPERLFSFTWHPYAVDPKVDYSSETPTLVEFILEPSGSGTSLLIRESGFDQIPAQRQIDALRMNDDGWTQQIKNIEAHVTQAAR